MSEQEYIEFNERLNKGLKESFYKMLELKRKLGQEVVTCDEHGNTIVISAEEAWEMARRKDKAAAPDSGK